MQLIYSFIIILFKQEISIFSLNKKLKNLFWALFLNSRFDSNSWVAQLMNVGCFQVTET